MAKKKFEVERVIDTAISIFWKHGYAATSIQMIVNETGLKPGSIYHEFGSKEGLFRLALSQYAQQSIENGSRIILESENVLEGIKKLLKGLVESSGTTDYCGCFLIKSQLELASQNDAIYVNAVESLKKIETNYISHLGQIYPTKTATLYASQLMMVIFGLRIYGYQKGAQQKITTTIESLLPWLYESN